MHSYDFPNLKPYGAPNQWLAELRVFFTGIKSIANFCNILWMNIISIFKSFSHWQLSFIFIKTNKYLLTVSYKHKIEQNKTENENKSFKCKRKSDNNIIELFCCCSDWALSPRELKLLLGYHMPKLLAFIIFINLVTLWNQDNRFSFSFSHYTVLNALWVEL